MLSMEPDYAGLEALTKLVDGSQLRVHVEHAFPLAHVAKAHELSAAGGVAGKIVLDLRDLETS